MHRFKNLLYMLFILLLAGVCTSPGLIADTVVLKNGKKFEGIIKKETSDGVTINIGLGTVSFNRNQIASIKRSKKQEIENNWQREFATRGKFVPAGLSNFAEQFYALESSRNIALKARAENIQLQHDRTNLFEEITAIQNEISNIASQFQSIIPEKNVNKYNQLVKKQNRLTSRAVIIKNALQNGNAQANTNRETISAYLTQLDDFKKGLSQEELQAKEWIQIPDSKISVFFSSINQQIDKFSTEFQQIEIPHKGASDHMLITARLNDRIDGVFLLDTGATYVTLSSQMAQNLNLGLSGKNKISVSLANGSNVDAQPVVLESMQVGDARVDGVIAMVFPDAPHQDVDGLLGMSFLREFTIHLDPVNKKLVFQKFDPN